MLPEHHHDEQVDDRATERIEAFIEGPDATPRQRPTTISRERRPVELDTRPDWTAAFRHEGARHARYGRSASVLLIELGGSLEGATVDQAAHRLADAIRSEARETDRAVRVGAVSFRVLLPETGGRAARRLAERLDRAFRADIDGRDRVDGVELCVEVATPARTASLEDALAEAEARLREERPAGLVDQRRHEVVELGRGVVAQSGVDLGRLDDRARWSDQPVEPLGGPEPGDRSGRRVAGRDPFDRVEVRPDGAPGRGRARTPPGAARRGRSGRPGTASAGTAG